VATHPKYRNRGYAAALMRSLHHQLQEQSYDCAILWTSVPDFYARLGWQAAMPHGVMTGLANTFSKHVTAGLYECLPFDLNSHLDAVLELYNQNPIRLVRSRYQAERLFSLPKVHVWVAAREGQVVAYACHAQAINKHGITEYGGELDGILALLGHIAQTLKDDVVVPLLVYPTRPDLAEQVRKLGMSVCPLPRSKGTNHEMVYAVPPGGLPPEVCDRLFVWGLDHA
jgi:hypothetical protein